MRYRSWILALALCASARGRSYAQGDDAPAYESRVRAARAGSVTVIELDEPSARITSVAEALSAEAGIEVRSRGGLGAFSSVSIRGADANEVAVFVDGIPLSGAAAGVVDLSQLPTSGLQRIEVWRGVPPVELGGEAVGGAINLVTRKGAHAPTVSAFAGAGSFGARSAGAGWEGTADRSGRLHASVHASYAGASGDFLYYDYGGTLLNTADDHVSRRRNDGFDQLALDATLGSSGPLHVTVDAHGFLKRQGVPGQAGTGADEVGSPGEARLTTGRLISSLSLQRAWRRLELSGRAHVLYERYGFTNPLAERVGSYGATVVEGEAVTVGASARADLALRRAGRFTALGEARVDRRRPYDLVRPSVAGPPVVRGAGALSLGDDLRLFGGRLQLLPGVRLDGIVSTQVTDASGTQLPGQTRSDAFVSPRLLVRAQPLDWLTLRGSAGRFVRFPTLLEQFGDGAFVLGSRYLRPESAWGGDAGVGLALHRRRASATLEGTFFGRQVDDYISWLPSAYALAAANLGTVRVLGAEARAEAQLWSLVRLALAYTLLDATAFTDQPGASGNQLPNRPRHHLFGRIELNRAPFRVFYDLDYASEVYRDAQNYNVLPARVLHALGAAVHHGAWTFSVDVRNLADLRVVDLPLGGAAHAGETTPYPLVDFFDYPLPGRSIYATLSFTHGT